MHSFFLVFYDFVCEWISIKQSEMKNNTEQQNLNTCLSWKQVFQWQQVRTSQIKLSVRISEFKQTSHSRLSSSKVVIRRVWRIRLFNLVMWRCVWFFYVFLTSSQIFKSPNWAQDHICALSPVNSDGAGLTLSDSKNTAGRFSVFMQVEWEIYWKIKAAVRKTQKTHRRQIYGRGLVPPKILLQNSEKSQNSDFNSGNEEEKRRFFPYK